MKSTLIALGLAASLGLVATGAQAKDLTGWFVNGGVGSAHYHATVGSFDLGSESDTSTQINVGWRSQFIGVEAGYTDLGSVGAHDNLGNGYKVSGDGWTLGLNGHFNPTDMWYVSARGGLFLWKLHAKTSVVEASGEVSHAKASQQSGSWYAGVGTGVDFNRNMSLGVNFDFYKIAKDSAKVNNKVYSVIFEYRF